MSNINQTPRDRDGKRHGEWTFHYKTNQLMYRKNYINGVEHELHEGYHPNGRLRYRGYYNMGRKVGYWYWFNQKRYYLWLI